MEIALIKTHRKGFTRKLLGAVIGGILRSNGQMRQIKYRKKLEETKLIEMEIWVVK